MVYMVLRMGLMYTYTHIYTHTYTYIYTYVSRLDHGRAVGFKGLVGHNRPALVLQGFRVSSYNGRNEGLLLVCICGGVVLGVGWMIKQEYTYRHTHTCRLTCRGASCFLRLL